MNALATTVPPGSMIQQVAGVFTPKSTAQILCSPTGASVNMTLFLNAKRKSQRLPLFSIVGADLSISPLILFNVQA